MKGRVAMKYENESEYYYHGNNYMFMNAECILCDTFLYTSHVT